MDLALNHRLAAWIDLNTVKERNIEGMKREGKVEKEDRLTFVREWVMLKVSVRQYGR